MVEIRVDFPLPEKPTMETNSPSSTWRSRPDSTSTLSLPLPKLLLTPFNDRKDMTATSALAREGEGRLQRVHDAVEQEADDADREHGHDDACERLRRSVLELVPYELSETRILRQHLGCDQHHPTNAERQPQSGEDQGQRTRQHQLRDRAISRQLQDTPDV